MNTKINSFIIMLFMAVTHALNCSGQDVHTAYIGKSREAIRIEEREKKMNFINSGISEGGLQYETFSVFSANDAWRASTIFYYDMNYNCAKVRLIADRSIAPAFIENDLNVKFHRIDNTTWSSFDAKYVVSLQITPGENTVSFDFITKEYFISH